MEKAAHDDIDNQTLKMTVNLLSGEIREDSQLLLEPHALAIPGGPSVVAPNRGCLQ